VAILPDQSQSLQDFVRFSQSWEGLTDSELDKMDAAIDLSDASKALDLSNIRFQLMYVSICLILYVC
jgi:hypothetical protein